MIRSLKKWLSTVLIASLCAGFIVVPDHAAFADDRPEVDLVAILVDSALMKDETPTPVREDLRTEFPAQMHNITLAERVRRYADDIQAKLPMSKILIIPTSPSEEPWRITETLAKLYVEGDGSTNTVSKLKGIVLIGSVPLPLVTKNNRSYLSLFPYTDFDDPQFAYDANSGSFLSQETSGRPQPEVWHGVIPYPISWEQFLRDPTREKELSSIRRKLGMEAYAAKLDALESEYRAEARTALAEYFDKNHSFYAKGSYSLFSKKAILMDIFREFQSVSDFGLAGYSAYLENWDNKSYMRYTREWLARLQGTNFKDSLALLGDEQLKNPDGSVMSEEQLIAKARAEIQANPNISDAEKERQVRSLSQNSEKTKELTIKAAEGITQSAVVPDIFTRDPIESFLYTPIEVFGAIVGKQAGFFRNTGRWSLTGEAGDRDAFTIYKIVQMLDETGRKDILEVNTALENEVDSMLKSAAEESLHLQLDIPTTPINYFGRFTSVLYKAPKDFTNLGDIFNSLGQSAEYAPGHWFYLDLKPTPPEGTTREFAFDAQSFLDQTVTDSGKKKFIPYTGQKYTRIVHHMNPERQNDLSRMLRCTQSNWQNWGWVLGPVGGLIGASFAGGDKEKECTIFFDNPSPAQLKFVELYDPKDASIPVTKQLEVLRYQMTVSLKEYISATPKPDIAYVSQQIIAIGDLQLFLDWGNFLKENPVNWQRVLDRLTKHEKYLYDWNKDFVQFQVIVHVVDMPFTAEQCSIYLGGAPETAQVGGEAYPIYLRGGSTSSATRDAANSWENASGNARYQQNTAAWREDKVARQVQLSLATEQQRIRAKEMEIKYVQSNPPRGDNVTAEQMEAWRERLRKLKEEKTQMERVRDAAKTMFTQIWGLYYGTTEGDAGRFGAYLEHIGTMASEATLAKQVEANRLYDKSMDAVLRVKNPDSDTPEQKTDNAALLDPRWFGYKDLRLDKRPEAYSFPDWFDFSRNGYWGGCSAQNLQRVEDTAKRTSYTGLRADMQTIFSQIQNRHIDYLRSKDKGALDWLKYIQPLVLVGVGIADFSESQAYFQTVTLYNQTLYNTLERMLSDDAYQPKSDSPDAIESTIAIYKKLLDVQKDLLLRDLTDAEYQALKPELAAIITQGTKEMTAIQRVYQSSMAKSPEDRKKGEDRYTLNPAKYGVNAPAKEFRFTDGAVMEEAKSMLIDLVQAQYEIKLIQTTKVSQATLAALADFGGRAVSASNAAIMAVDGEVQRILAATTVYDALTFVGITCDPQRAMEPIFDRAGGTAVNDPDYLPLRTTERTVTIREVNTLAPTILSGVESWTKPSKIDDMFPPKSTYTPPKGGTIESNMAPTWKEPILQERLVAYPSVENASDTQVYRDDYPRTRAETLYNPLGQANSYAEGWEYTRKGFVIEENQPKGPEKDINAGLSPENSYLACLRYAKYGVSESPIMGVQPKGIDQSSPKTEDALQHTSSPVNGTLITGWPLVDAFMRGGVGSVPFTIKGLPANTVDQNILLAYMKEFTRRANSDAGNWRLFPRAEDKLEMKQLIPFEYKGKWDFKFEYIAQGASKLEQFFQEALHGDVTDVNDPTGRRTLYALNGVRRIATVVTHKEPTYETIAQQVQSMSSTSLPVNNPRYVDFYLYEPLPKFNIYGEVEKWDEYEEHVSIPYVNFFRAFPDQKTFSYALDTDRAQLQRDLEATASRVDSLITGFNNYLVDYVAKTSLSGPKATLPADSLRVDTSSISDPEVKKQVESLASRVLGSIGSQEKSPAELQTILQQGLGGVKSTTALAPTKLESISFDQNRWNTVLSKTSLADGEGDKVSNAKKRLAFSVYWQHLSLAEKYKFVMHNYLTSSPSDIAIDTDFWQQRTKYTDPVQSQKKVGFEAGTLILESARADAMQIPLESLTGKGSARAAQAPSIVPTLERTESTQTSPCDNEYAGYGGSKFGVPLQNWLPAIGCWATHLWPLEENAEQNALNLVAWGKAASKEGERFTAQTGRFVEDLGKTGDALLKGGELVIKGTGAVLDTAGKWLQDLDQDGLSSLFQPLDSNVFSPDVLNERFENKPNGFRDGQDYVKKLLFFSGREATVLPEAGSPKAPAGQTVGVIPFGSNQPFEVHVLLLDAANRPLLADQFDMVRLEIHPEDAATSVLSLAPAEQVQKVENGAATFRVFARNSSKAFGTTRVVATLLKQKLPNSSYTPEPSADITATYAITVTPEVLSGAFYRIPCTSAERDAGTCARGDVRSTDVDSIFSTNESAHLLTLIATDMSKKDTVVQKSGNAQLRYYKDEPRTENLYKKAMGGQDAISMRLEEGAYAAALPIPKESGKYFLEVVPESSMNLAPVLLSFMVVDTTYSTMRLEMDPPVAIEGQKVTLRPKFTNSSGEEVGIGLGMATIGIPKSAGLDTAGLMVLDAMPGGDTADHLSLDIAAGGKSTLELTLPEGKGTSPYTLDFLLSKIAPLSQITAQAGSLDQAIGQRLVTRVPYMVYPKGSLSLRATLPDGSSSVTVPVMTSTESACVDGPIANAARAFTVKVELRDKDGRLVPYDGAMQVSTQDLSLFTALPGAVQLLGGRGELTVTPSRKSGSTDLIFTDAAKQMTKASLRINVTPGALAALSFTTKSIRPLEATAEGLPEANSLAALRYVGVDLCGNPVDAQQSPTIALDVQPEVGDGTQIRLHAMTEDADAALVETTVMRTGMPEENMLTQKLRDGRGSFALEAVNFRGEAQVTVRALMTNGDGKTVINERILPDTVRIPIRLTLRRELLESLEPNMLYTNLLGGPYGDVTQKDFLGGWWMLTGKTQVVTTSTVASEIPANLARVLPNGAIDLGGGREAGGVSLFADPVLAPNMPFTVDVKDQSDGATVMQVRYNIVPFQSGAVFENTPSELSPAETAPLAPGIYVIPAPGVTTKKDLLGANRSIVRIFAPNEEGVLQERAIIADNLQFFRGVSVKELPLVAMDLDRKDLVYLRVSDGESKTPLATLMVKLDPQRVFPADGDYDRDIQLSLDTVRAEAVNTAEATIENQKVNYGESLAKFVAEAEAVAPQILAPKVLHYLRQTITELSELQGVRDGVIGRLRSRDVLKLEGSAENIGFYVGSQLLLPLRNISNRVVEAQAWLGKNLLRYALSLEGDKMQIIAKLVSADDQGTSITALKMTPVYGATPLLWQDTPATEATGMYLSSTRATDLTYAMNSEGLRVRAKDRGTRVQTNFADPCSLPESAQDIVLAGIKPTGETFTCFDGYSWERTLMTENTSSRIAYVLREDREGRSRIVAEASLVLGADRALPVRASSSGAPDLFSMQHQGVYVRFEDASHLWNEEQGVLVRKDPLPGQTQGFVSILNVRPGAFLTLSDAARTSGEYRLLTVGNVADVPLFVLEEQRNGVWARVATLRIQLQETSPRVQTFASLSAVDPRAAEKDVVNVYALDPSLITQETSNSIRITSPSEGEMVTINKQPLRILSLGSGVNPELLDVTQDRFTVRFVGSDGTERARIAARFDTAYTQLMQLASGTSLPEARLGVPGLYTEMGEPLLRFNHSSDRTTSTLFFGFEPVLVVEKMGGQRVLRPDMASNTYTPALASGGLLAFTVSLFGTPALELYYSMANLPFDLRVLTYTHASSQLNIPSEGTDATLPYLRPKTLRRNRPVLNSIGDVLRLENLQASLETRNSALKNTKISMTPSLNAEGLITAALTLDRLDTAEQRTAATFTYVPYAAASPVTSISRANINQSLEGLRIVTDTAASSGECVRTDTVVLSSATTSFRTCSDAEGVRFDTVDGKVYARIRHDGSYRTFDDRVSIQTKLFTGAAPQIRYTLATKEGTPLLSDVALGSSSSLVSTLRVGAPASDEQALPGTYVPYVAKASDSRAAYTLMQQIPGVEKSASEIVYCRDMEDPARTCATQLSLSEESFLRTPETNFAFTVDSTLKTADDYTIPAFGYLYTPTNTRVATLAFVLRESPLTTKNVQLSAGEGTTVREEAGRKILQEGTRDIARVSVATGRLETVGTLRLLDFTPSTVRVQILEGNTVRGTLTFLRDFAGEGAHSGALNTGRAGLYYTPETPLFSVSHALDQQTTTVTFGFDTLMTLRADGSVDIRLPDFVRTVLLHDTKDALTLRINSAGERVDLGDILAAFPLKDISQRLRIAEEKAAGSGLETRPFLRSFVDGFGNIVSEFRLRKNGTTQEMQSAQTRSVYAPSALRLLRSANPDQLSTVDIPTVAYNPLVFRNAVTNTAYSVEERGGNLFVVSPSAHGFWTGMTTSEPLCHEEFTRGGVAAVLLADGSRLVCDPLHEMRLRLDAPKKLFAITVTTKQQKANTSSDIGTFFVYPGNTARFRLLTGVGDFAPEDKASNFASSAIYLGVQEDYAMNGTTLGLKTGDQSDVLSLAAANFGALLNQSKVWNQTENRFALRMSNEDPVAFTVVPRRLPLAFDVLENREMRFTANGAEPWVGTVTAAKVRLTLTEPTVKVDLTGGSDTASQPQFTCAPNASDVLCERLPNGHVRLLEQQSTNASIVNGSYGIPALVIKKDASLSYVETGLWNGRVVFDGGVTTGIASIDLFDAAGQVRARLMYRPTLLMKTPTVSVFTPGQTAPALSLSTPQLQVLLGNQNVRLLEQGDFYVVSVDEPLSTDAESLMKLGNNGFVRQFVQKLQNLEVVSFDGNTADIVGSVGQFGFLLRVTRTGGKWILGSLSGIATGDQFVLGTYADRNVEAPLPRGSQRLTPLQENVTITEDAEKLRVMRADTVLLDVLKDISGRIILREGALAQKHISTETMEETLVYEEVPDRAVVKIAGNPRLGSNGTAEDPFDSLILVDASSSTPSLTTPGSAFIAAQEPSVTLSREGTIVTIAQTVNGTSRTIAQVDTRTLRTLPMQDDVLTWSRQGSALIETYVATSRDVGLVRLRKQARLPSLLPTADLVASFAKGATTAPVITAKTAAETRRLTIPEGTLELFGTRLSATIDNGLRLSVQKEQDLLPAPDMHEEVRRTELMTLDPERFLVSSLKEAVELVPQTLLPNMQTYTVRNRADGRTLATISRTDPRGSRYIGAKTLAASASLTQLDTPGMLLSEISSPVRFDVNNADGSTTVMYGFDTVGTISRGGDLNPKSPDWSALTAFGRTLRSQLEGVQIDVFGASYARFMVRRNASGYANAGLRNSIFMESRDLVGTSPLAMEFANDRPLKFSALDQTLLSWTNQMVGQVGTSSIATSLRYVFEARETGALKFTLSSNNTPLTSVFVQTVADLDGGNGTGQGADDVDAIGSLPVDKVTEALDILGGTGIYVQIRSPEKGLFHLAYEPQGDSTNNLYAVALRDESLPLMAGDLVNPSMVGVEDALEPAGEGLGFAGDYKNMLLFAGGNTVGESTLPYMSEALINLGDPVISISLEESDRSNEYFTDDIGEVIYTHTGGQIQQMVLYDVDQDGREDIVFTDGDGKLQVLRNQGGKPVAWTYLGATFEIPEGIRELLIMQLAGKKNLAVAVGSPTSAPQITTEGAITAADAVLEKSLVELKNTSGLLERCKNTVPNLGALSDATFGDLDGDGTDDLVALTKKNELKVVSIDPSVDCNTKSEETNKQRYSVTEVDVLGMQMDGTPLNAPEGQVPAGFHLLPEGDIYARFNGSLIKTWNPLESICPAVDPRNTTPVYPSNQVPTVIPSHPEMVFEAEPKGMTNADVQDGVGDIVKNLDERYPGSEGVYYSYQDGGSKLMRMLVAADLPYIRSGGQALIRYNEAFKAVAKANPFSCVAGGFGGVGNFLSGVADQFGALTGFLTGPVKTLAFQSEANAALNPASTLTIKKYGKDLNGGVVQVGDTLSYALVVTNNLPGNPTKNMDIADRFQQGTELLGETLVCRRGAERTACTAMPSKLFGLYVPNLEVKGGETITITYQAKVVTSPVDLTLQLIDVPFMLRAITDSGLYSLGSMFTIFANLPNAEKRRLISVSTDAAASTGGMFTYFRMQSGEFGSDIIAQRPKANPLSRLPVIGKLLESFGLVWGDDGQIDTNAQADTSPGNTTKSTKTLNNLLSNAFLATDRDQDGLIDLWDDDVRAPALEVADIARLAQPSNGPALAFGAIADAAKNAGSAVGSFVSKVDASLDIVNRELAQSDCQNGGCALVPPSLNTAFLAPKPEFSLGETLDGTTPKGILRNISNQTDYAIFAYPTVQPPFFWPGTGIYTEVKTTSQFRVYLSPTLTGRFGLTACVGPYAVGMIDLPVPTGVEPNKNCYTYILPDILGIREFCQDLAAGLSGFIGGLGRMVSSGGYTAARAQRTKSIAGMAENERAAPFVSDHFQFKTTRFANPPGAGFSEAVNRFMKDFRSLGQGLGNMIPQNNRSPAFPAIIMDWAERQMHEVLAKLTKLPTITLILPDPTLGFTRPMNPANDTLAKRQQNQDLTSMDVLTQRVTDLSTALETGTTESDLAKKAAAKQLSDQALSSCKSRGGVSCDNPGEVAAQLGKLELAKQFGMMELPANADAFTDEETTIILQSIDARLTEIRSALAGLPAGAVKTKLAESLAAVQTEWNSASGSSTALAIDQKTRALLAEVKIAQDPTYATTQLRALNQMRASEADRKALANCDESDPIGCTLNSAEYSFSEFMQGINVNTGTSNADITRILDAGISSNDLLKREVRGFSEVLAIVGSLPFVSIQMQDVVFYYPWLPPDRVSEFLYQLEGTKNQSIENFHAFYGQWAFCFFEPDAEGRVNWNKALPPTFTLRENLEASLANSATSQQSAGATFQHCLAAARVAEDAYAGLAGIDTNIQRIKEYGNIVNSMKQYLQWKTYVMGRLLRIVSTVVNQIIGYVQTQNQILARWRDSIRSISQAMKSFQVLVDVFASFQQQCQTCNNQQGTDAANLMDLLGNFIQLQVVPFPKWPDVEIDLSQINMRYQVVIPNIRFIPQQINLPRFTPIVLPNLGPLPQARLALYAQTGLQLTLPLLPALPNLPRLPELPVFRMPKFPNLPPPPTVPQLNVQVRTFIQTIGKVITLICLVQRNVLPIAESRVRSHLEAQTTSPQIVPSGQRMTTPSFEPTLDRIRVSTQIGIVLDTNRPLGQDTYMWLFREAARSWNGFVRSMVNPANFLLSDLPQQLYGTAVGFVSKQVKTYAIDQINRTLAETNRNLNSFFQNSLTLPVNNFQGAVRQAVEEKRREVSGQTAAVATPKDQAEILKTIAKEDPISVALIDQLLTLQESIVTTSQSTGLASSDAYIEDLKMQRDFLASDASGLPESMRRVATEKLSKIIDEATAPAPRALSELDPNTLPYVAGWQNLASEVADEEKALKSAEVLSAKLGTAATFEDFTSVLAKTGMLAEEQFDEKPIASLGEQDSRNTESQRMLNEIAGAVAKEIPLDVRDTTIEKTIARSPSLLAQSPEVGGSGEAVASNVDKAGAPLLAQVTAAPAVTNVSATASLPEPKQHQSGIGKEEEGNILVELPGNGGLVTLMSYVPPAGMPVHIAFTALQGDIDNPDIVYSMGSDIYVKYNKRTPVETRTTEQYRGTDRIRELSDLRDIATVLPRVQGASVLGVDANQVVLQFRLPPRTKQVDRAGKFFGDDAQYILRVYDDIRGLERGESPLDYVIVPIDASLFPSATATLSEIVERNTAAMPEAVRTKLTEEALKQGLPESRILLGRVEGKELTVTLPVQGRETPMFMRIVPRLAGENAPMYGLSSALLFAHPQRAQDTVAPLISLPRGENMTVPLERPLVLEASAEDAINDVVAVAWDKDILVDSNNDGDPANDEDVVCSAQTPCDVKPTEMGAHHASKAQTPALMAPKLSMTWSPGDAGLHTLRLMARDSLGNTSYKDLRITVAATEIRTLDYNPKTGRLRGSVYPPQPSAELQLLRLRDGVVSELLSPMTITTDAASQFVMDGILPGEGSVLLNRDGSVVETKEQNP